MNLKVFYFYPLFQRFALIIYGLFFYFSISCLSFNSNFNERDLDEPYSEVYQASFHQVWKALQITMKDYSLKVNDIEQGIIETQWIRKKMYWKPPYGQKSTSRVMRNSRYRLKIQVVQWGEDEKEEMEDHSTSDSFEGEDLFKEKIEESKKSRKSRKSKKSKKSVNPKASSSEEAVESVKRKGIQVLVLKKIYRKRDFFSDEEALISDGMEEKILLYRLGREIHMAKTLDQLDTKM